MRWRTVVQLIDAIGFGLMILLVAFAFGLFVYATAKTLMGDYDGYLPEERERPDEE
jgi:hypothetical protein